MLIVGCQTCGEAKILDGTPDGDGLARVQWTCPRCGTGQVLQLEISSDARGDLRKILGGLALMEKDKENGKRFEEKKNVFRGMFGRAEE